MLLQSSILRMLCLSYVGSKAKKVGRQFVVLPLHEQLCRPSVSRSFVRSLVRPMSARPTDRASKPSKPSNQASDQRGKKSSFAFAFAGLLRSLATQTFNSKANDRPSIRILGSGRFLERRRRIAKYHFFFLFRFRRKNESIKELRASYKPVAAGILQAGRAGQKAAFQEDTRSKKKSFSIFALEFLTRLLLLCVITFPPLPFCRGCFN